VTIRRSLGLSLVQRYVTLVVSFGTTMYVSRQITPAEMGVFFLSFGLLLILMPIAQMSIGGYIVQERELDDRRMGTAIGVLLLSSAAAVAAVLLGRHAVAAYFGEPGVASVLAVMGSALALIPLTTPATGRLLRDMRFGALLVIGLAGTVLQAITAITLTHMGFSYMSLAWAFLVEQIAITLVTLWFCPGFGWVRPRLAEWRHIVRVGAAITVSMVSDTLGKAIPTMALGRAVSLEAAGLYSRARTVTDLYARSVLEGIVPVLMPALARLHREGRDMAGPVALTYGYLGVMAWPFFAVLAILADPALRILFGPQWGGAVPVLQILCLLGAMMPTGVLLRELLVGTGRSNLEMRIQVATQVARVVLVIAVAPLGMIAVTWALVASQALLVVAALVVMTRVVAVSLRQLAVPTLQNVLVTAATAAGPWLVMREFAGTWNAFALAGAAGALAALGWIVGLLVTRHPILAELERVRPTGRFRLVTAKATDAP
jgi:O-antigen/teichoic acid export membrane protein